MNQISTPFIITLTGPSRCGKSFIIQEMKEVSKELREEGYSFFPQNITKYSTRDYREEEYAAIRNYEKEKERLMKLNVKTDIELDTLNWPLDIRHIDEIPKDCDFIYQSYGNMYGVEASTLESALNENKCPVVIINDVRVIEEMKKIFPNKVLSLFIFRKIPKIEDFVKNNDGRKNVSKKEQENRFKKADAIYKTYIENITLFDKVILNVKGDIDNVDITFNTRQQLKNLIRSVLNGRTPLKRSIIKGPKLFIISGNAMSGKDQLIRSCAKMGKLQAFIQPKYTSRMQDDEDDSEMICQFIPKKEEIERLNKEYEEKIQLIKSKRYDVEAIEFYYRNVYSKKHQEELDLITEEQVEIDFDNFISIEIKNEPTGSQRFWEKISSFRKNKELEIQSKCITHLRQNKINEIINTDKDGITAFLAKYNEICQKNHVESKDFYSEWEDSEKNLAEIYFEKNDKYVDLQKICESSENGRKLWEENGAGYIDFDNTRYAIYKNNGDIAYGFVIDSDISNDETGSLKDVMMKCSKHCVLVCSVIEIFNVCRSLLIKDVVTIFSYSQLGKKEIESNSNLDTKTKTKKIEQSEKALDDYAKNIVEYDHVTIYANDGSEKNEALTQEELSDQLFRLFRAYNA